MSPHYDPNFVAEESLRDRATGVATDDDAIEDAAEALRELEVEAAQSPGVSVVDAYVDELDAMSIDDLRKFAASRDVPHRAQIIDRDELVAAIRADFKLGQRWQCFLTPRRARCIVTDAHRATDRVAICDRGVGDGGRVA